MLTNNGMTKILKRMMETYGLDIEEDIQRIRDDFSEREGILRNYGDFPEDEDLDDFDFVAREVEQVDGDYKERYDELLKSNEELRQRYIDRFFNGVEPSEEKAEEQGEEIIEEQIEDVQDDGTEKTIDDLFEKVEG